MQEGIDYNKHKDDFFKYVIEHERELKYALRKNITYDEELFDDVTADTLCRIGEYILRKQAYIKDFKGLFFISAKRQYIAVQNKKREMEGKMNRTLFINMSEDYMKAEKQEDVNSYLELAENDGEALTLEKKAENTHKLFKYLEEELNKRFEGNEVDIFLIYFRLKSERKGISYKKLANIMDKDVKYITRTIVKIKKYVKESREIQETKKRIMKEEL